MGCLKAGRMARRSCGEYPAERFALTTDDWSRVSRLFGRKQRDYALALGLRLLLRRARRGKWDLERLRKGADVFLKMEVPDEGYFSTVLCLLGFPLDEFVEKKASTWTHWEGGPHPLSHETLSDDHLRSILESGALFARKFPKGADVGTFGLHR